MRFNLERWGDEGDVHLAYWDHLHGDDVIIRLEGGKAFLVDYVEEEFRLELGSLVDFLCELIEERSDV